MNDDPVGVGVLTLTLTIAMKPGGSPEAFPPLLVRDGREVSQDPPPEGPPTRAPVKIDVDTASSFGSDLVRAEDVTRFPYDPSSHR